MVYPRVENNREKGSEKDPKERGIRGPFGNDGEEGREEEEE